METFEDFEKHVRHIFELIGTSGIKAIDYNTDLLNEEYYQDLFISNTHEGFKKAQNLIYEKLVEFEQEKKDTKEVLRNTKDSEAREQLQNSIKIINGREHVLRKLADTIAWQLIRGEHFVARRLYNNEVYPSLLSDGTKEVKKYVDSVNDNPLNFALISDPTTFVQTGDVIQVDWKRKSFGLVEVKSGKANDIAFEYLTKYAGNMEELANDPSVNAKMYKQIERIKNQVDRGQEVSDFIRNEGGEDLKNDINYKAVSHKNHFINYDDVIFKLISDSSAKKMGYIAVSYGDVAGVMHIGVYRQEFRDIGKSIIEEILEKDSDNYIVTGYSHNIFTPISIPIFLAKLPIDTIFDILSGRIVIYIGLDLDKIVDLFKFIGIEARWLSKSETHKIKEISKEKSLKGVFIHKDRAIGVKIEEGGPESLIGDGIIARILHDHIDPFSLLQIYGSSE